jgi:hypothetical protein
VSIVITADVMKDLSSASTQVLDSRSKPLVSFRCNWRLRVSLATLSSPVPAYL